MVEGSTTGKKQQSASNKSFADQHQAKIVLRHLPPTWTSEQFLEMVSPLPDHDYYRFCKADLSLGQQFSFSRAYLNIPNRQDLILFVEKFQGYIFLDKSGNEYICSVEYAPNQTKPKSESQMRKDPKVNSIEQDPDYQTFVANMNAPATGADALPNAEAMLEEIERKQREIHETRNKSGVTTTPLLEYLKQKREDRRQEKILRNQRRTLKQQARAQPSNVNEDVRPSSGRNVNDDEYHNSSRYGNRHSQRGYDKGDYRTSNNEQKRSNQHEHQGGKSSKHQHPKGKANPPKEPKPMNNPKSKAEENPSVEQPSSAIKRENSTTEPNLSEDRSTTKTPSSASSQKGPTKARPSMQIYNPGERIRMRRQQNNSSTTPN